VSDSPAEHIPVLSQPVLELLRVSPGEVVCDATVGLAGHARLLGDATGSGGQLIGMDADPGNLDLARRHLEGCPAPFRLFHANFAALDAVLKEADLDAVDVVLADLGVSSNQLDDPARGFSFTHVGPLDMRMDPTLTETAADLVNRLKEDELSDLIYFNAQERFSRRIGKRICDVRREKRITTTAELAAVVCDALHADPKSHRAKIHPATRTFMALRMAVNDELGALRSLLATAARVLRPGGRIGVIAFHSVEDGVVKRDFAQRKQRGDYRLLTKRPVIAGPEEREANPRSRSAKLRVAERVASNSAAPAG
jgi:16S rRNA (cytosine1402-N4)-methyltransferase